MMTPSVRKLYKEAIINEQFNEEFKEADSEYRRPTVFSDYILKHYFVAVYQGWLIARGEFDDTKY